MTILVATSVVRGSCQGESHGGVYLVDLEARKATQTVDWNRMDIDWQGRGWDRGLRGIAFNDGQVCIAASDELFCPTRLSSGCSPPTAIRTSSTAMRSSATGAACS